MAPPQRAIARRTGRVEPDRPSSQANSGPLSDLLAGFPIFDHTWQLAGVLVHAAARGDLTSAGPGRRQWKGNHQGIVKAAGSCDDLLSPTSWRTGRRLLCMLARATCRRMRFVAQTAGLP